MAWTIEARRRYKREWNQRNKGRYAAQSKAWFEANKSRLAGARLVRNLWKFYGLTLAEYRELLVKQEGRCAICGRAAELFKKGLGVDHNHKTKRVRALLCPPCNTGIGLLQDDPGILRAAALYVEAHR